LWFTRVAIWLSGDEIERVLTTTIFGHLEKIKPFPVSFLVASKPPILLSGPFSGHITLPELFAICCTYHAAKNLAD
jgi:hypothetical protein